MSAQTPGRTPLVALRYNPARLRRADSAIPFPARQPADDIQDRPALIIASPTGLTWAAYGTTTTNA